MVRLGAHLWIAADPRAMAANEEVDMSRVREVTLVGKLADSPRGRVRVAGGESGIDENATFHPPNIAVLNPLCLLSVTMEEGGKNAW